MVRSELVEKVAELHPYLQRRDVERVVETIFGEIGNALARGARTEIRGFGSFAIKHREARTGRNPKTGVTVEVPRRTAPYFRIGKLLHARLNEEH
jgi:integration host factor subunit beta